MKYRFRFALVGEELLPIENGYIEVDDDGTIVGYGTGRPSSDYIDLGNVIITPKFTNAHVHVLDMPMMDMYDKYYIDDLVGFPHGVKYHELRKSMASVDKHIAEAAESMRRYGIGCTAIFAEYGAYTADRIKGVFERAGIKSIVFAEPINRDELPMLSGRPIEVASPLDYTEDDLRSIRREAPLVATHVAETRDCYESGDLELAVKVLEADMLVHLTQVEESDMHLLRGKTIVLNPRANTLLVGHLPPVELLLNYEPLLGTDNMFINEPNVLEEARYLYITARLRDVVLDPRDLLKMLITHPHKKFGCPLIEVGQRLNANIIRVKYVAAVSSSNLLGYLVKRVDPKDIVGEIVGPTVVMG